MSATEVALGSRRRITINMALLEQTAWFAAAEAHAQGYDMETERAQFLRHIENTARQYFIKEGVDPFLAMVAEPSNEPGVLASVAAVLRFRGRETELGRWPITAG